MFRDDFRPGKDSGARLPDIGLVALTTANNYPEPTMNPFPGLAVAQPFVAARAALPVVRDAAHDFHQGLQAALIDQIALGLIVCDRHASLCFANEAARLELSSERVLRLSGDSLRCAGGRSMALDAALRQAAVKGRRQLLMLANDDERLMVTLMPLAQDDGAEPLLLLVLGQRGACSTLGLEMLASAYSLTLAERRVLGGLVGDISPRDIAASGGVSLSTVRTQIAAIRTKLGVRNVEGVLLLAAQVPMVPSALRCGQARRRGADAPPQPGRPARAAWAAAHHPRTNGDHHVELQ